MNFLARQAQRVQSKVKAVRAMRARNYNVRLSEELTRFYATHPLSPWQRAEVDKIRKSYEGKLGDLNMAHDIAASRLSDKFMQLELDWLRASHEFKENNPGIAWHPSGIRGVFSRAFWANLAARAGQIGVVFNKGDGEASKG